MSRGRSEKDHPATSGTPPRENHPALSGTPPRENHPALSGTPPREGNFRERRGEILFIDARNLGHLINRRTRELSKEDIDKIANTYHAWKNSPPLEGATTAMPEGRAKKFPSSGGVPAGRGGYEDVPGFCSSTPLSKVRELDYVLTPGRYVGLPDEEDDFNFAERFASLKTELEEQLKEEARLNKLISTNLLKINFNE